MSLTVEDAQVLRPAALEVEGRPYRVTKLDVIDYAPDLEREGTLLVKPGSIGLFVAPRGSKLLQQIRRVAAAGDGSDRALAEQIRKNFEGRTQMRVEDAVRLLVQQPVFASLRYGGRTLVSSVFTPAGTSIAAVAMHYNGGSLSREGFSLVEHYVEDAKDRLEGIVIRHAPELTRAEKAALKKLPSDMLEMNVGSAAFCFALSVVAVAAVVCLATGICCPHRSTLIDLVSADSTPVPDLHISDAQVSRLTAAATARHILRIRREMLEHRL